MTKAAIKLLQKDEDGFFLFVEGARIDMAHHNLLSKKALEDTLAFADAVSVAINLTSIEDTLIVVTADHAHTMTLNGYAARGNNILATAGTGSDNLPYLSLSYANGIYTGYLSDGSRHDVTNDDFDDKDYLHTGMVPIDSETHGGDDVGIYARGPWAHLLTGVNEQNVIPHVMAYAACIGSGSTVCEGRVKSSGGTVGYPHLVLVTLAMIMPIVAFFRN